MDVTTVTACRDLEINVGRLETGTGRLAPPSLVYRDNPVWVQFEVARPGATSTLAQRAEVRQYPTPVSGHMSAVLVGDGFRIEAAPLPGERSVVVPQPIGTNGTSIWKWHVTAFAAPQHNLTLEVYVHIPVKNKDASGTYSVSRVLAETIPIPVTRTWGQMFDDSVNWVSRGTTGVKRLTGLLVALGALVAAYFALRRRMKKARPPTPPSARRGRHQSPAGKKATLGKE